MTGLSEKDAHFEGLGMWKIQLEAVPSLTLEHLRKVDADTPRTGSLVIFDDVDRITDDKMNKAVQKLISSYRYAVSGPRGIFPLSQKHIWIFSKLKNN